MRREGTPAGMGKLWGVSASRAEFNLLPAPISHLGRAQQLCCVNQAWNNCQMHGRQTQAIEFVVHVFFAANKNYQRNSRGTFRQKETRWNLIRASISINQHLSSSISTNQRQSASVSINKHMNQHQSAYQLASVGISHHQSACQSAYQSASISINQHQ